MGSLDDKPFGVVPTDGSQGDKGEAIKKNVKFLGLPSESVKFEGEPAHDAISASIMNSIGRE